MAIRPTIRADLNLLAVLEAVVAEGSLTKGGARLGMSQSTVSHALRRLRRLADDPLVERRGRIIVPTQRAIEIAARTRRALDQLDATLSPAAMFDPTREPRRFLLELPGGLDAVIAPTLAERLPADSLARFRMVTGRAANLRSEVNVNEIWLGIGYDTVPAEGFVSERIASWQPRVIARKDTPALRRGLTRKFYATAEHVALETSRSVRESLLASRIQAAGVERTVTFTVASMQAVAALVLERGMLATVLPPLAAYCARHFAITAYPLPVVVPPVEVHAIWHNRMQTDQAHRWLRQLMIELVREL